MSQESSTESVAEYLIRGVLDDGGQFYRFLCPACEATFDTDYDARGGMVACDNCEWKGKASL